MSPTVLVARREIVEGLRSRALKISWVLTTLLIVFAALLPRLFDGGTSGRPSFVLGVVAPPPGFEPAVKRAAAAAEIAVTTRTVSPVEVERLVTDGTIDAALDGATLYGAGSIDTRLLGAVNQGRTELALTERAAVAGISDRTLAALLAPVEPVSLESLGAAERTGGQIGVATIAVVALFLTLTIYGTAVLNGVLNEKSSRVVEVILASISPRQLLTGKVVGIGILGLLQVALQASVALAVLKVAGPVTIPSGTTSTLLLSVVFFVLGYALFSTFYAMAGSLVSRQEDAQAAATPVALLLTSAYVSTIAVVLPAPNSLAARVLTYFPVTAPTTVLARTALDSIAWWEVALAAFVILLSAVVMIGLAARTYAGAVLSFGGRVKLREALRAGE